MNCPKCGFENAADVKFCQQCGIPMENVSNPASNENPQPPQKAWYKKWWIWLIVGIGAMTLLLGGTCAACTCVLLTSPTSEQDQSSTETSDYYTDTKCDFYDISYEYNSQWYVRKPIVGEGYEYTSPDSSINLSVYALNYNSEEEVDILLEEYRKPKNGIEQIDEIKYTFEKSKTVIHRFMRLDSTESAVKYVDISAFGYSGKYYTFIIKSNSKNNQECEDIMDKTIDSITLYKSKSQSDETQSTTQNSTESHSTVQSSIAETTTKKPTEAPTEQKDIINNTSANGFWAKGNGDYIAQGLNVTGGYAVLHVESYSDRHFSIVSYKDGEYQDLLVNTSDPYSGDVLIEGSGTYELEIKSSGDWNITSRGLEIDDSTSFSGFGDVVTGITTHGGGNWKITCDSNRHFSVVEYSLSRGYLTLLANTSDPYSGVVKAKNGDDIFFEVNSQGNWTIEKQ